MTTDFFKVLNGNSKFGFGNLLFLNAFVSTVSVSTMWVYLNKLIKKAPQLSRAFRMYVYLILFEQHQFSSFDFIT